MDLLFDRINSPIGTILLVWQDGALRALDFGDYEPRLLRLLHRHYGRVQLIQGRAPVEIREPIQKYFDGDLTSIDPVPVTTGGTEFQKQVWAALRDIPAGRTSTYSEIACRIGRQNANRAVGLANGSNPIAIVVPCHRVIGADGSLTGYGGGIHRKRWLLDHERANKQSCLILDL